MKRIRLNVLLLAAVALLLSACSTAPKTETERQSLLTEANATLERFRASDLTIKDQMEKAYGYAVFPTVGKGAVGVGGAYGRGIVYEQGRPVGYCDLSQGSIGLQLGGQAYSELILFENKAALDRFKSSEFALAAQASAVAAASGAGANARYNDGVIVYTLAEKGLMYEASVGGQRFDYQPM